MLFNLIEKIQQGLGLQPLQKIDPNTQEVKRPENQTVQDYLPQAAIPAVLLGMYKYSRSVEGNTEILNGSDGNILELIFGDLTPKVVSQVATYTGNDVEYTASAMEKIAEQAAESMRTELKGKVTGNSIKALLTDQRHNILVHLPAGLQLGEIINDDTVDDRMNKMEGPLSSHMHWLEKLFSSSPPKQEDKHEAK